MLRLLLLIWVCCLVLTPAGAQTNESIAFQGLLSDENGQPLEGTFRLTFRMYTSAEGGTPVWDEVQPEVNVTNGLFGVHLGSEVGFGDVAFGQPLWISTQVGQESELMPRIQIGTVPFAFAVRGLRIDPRQNRWNVVAGNPHNQVQENRIGATISGGGYAAYSSTPAGQFPVINYGNRVFADYGTIGGGLDNQVTALAGIVGGGHSNAVSGTYGTVSGGTSNQARGNNSVVGGGTANYAQGEYSIVPGGAFSHARGAYSLAVGYHARAAHDGSFVWNDRSLVTPADSLFTTAPNQFLIRASGGVGIGTNNPSSPLTVAGTIESTEGGIRFPDGTVQSSAASGLSLPYSDIVESTDAAFRIENRSTSQTGWGIAGSTRSSHGRGVSGSASATTGEARGVTGQSAASGGAGVWGQSTSFSGPTSGVHGLTWSREGQGVFGHANSLTGITIGVRGRVSSPDGYAGYFEGPAGSRNYFERAVGIGTDNPTALLHLQTPAGEQVASINLKSAGSWTAQIRQTDDSRFNFHNGGNLRMTIRADGNVGIGTDSPSERLHVNGRVRASDFVTISDARVKTDVHTLTEAIDVVMQLRGVRFSWNESISVSDAEWQLGFIAQEVEQVLPEATTRDADGMLSVAYAQVIPLLVESIKEQQARIHDMEQAIRDLEAAVRILGERVTPPDLQTN
jgi:hypothetical protein